MTHTASLNKDNDQAAELLRSELIEGALFIVMASQRDFRQWLKTLSERPRCRISRLSGSNPHERCSRRQFRVPASEDRAGVPGDGAPDRESRFRPAEHRSNRIGSPSRQYQLRTKPDDR